MHFFIALLHAQGSLYSEKIGFAPAFNVDTSLLEDTMWFEEELMGNNATDFFHSRPVEYSKNSQTFDADDLF